MEYLFKKEPGPMKCDQFCSKDNMDDIYYSACVKFVNVC